MVPNFTLTRRPFRVVPIVVLGHQIRRLGNKLGGHFPNGTRHVMEGLGRHYTQYRYGVYVVYTITITIVLRRMGVAIQDMTGTKIFLAYNMT